MDFRRSQYSTGRQNRLPKHTSFEVTKTFSLLDNQALKLRVLNQYNHEKLTSANTATILGRY